MSRYTANIITKSPATPTGPTTTGRAPGIWRMDDVAYWTRQGLWPNPSIQAPDTYFPYVSLLLSTTSLGNANNSLFVDSSGAFNPVSRNGNTTQGSFTPYSTNWSNFFDGSGDYLTVSSNAAFGMGTGDFTIECWVNPTAFTGSGNVLVDMRSGTEPSVRPDLEYNSSGVLNYRVNGSTVISGGTLVIGTWSHVALARSGTTTKLFLNGVQVGSSYTDSNNYGSSAACRIGADDDGSPNAYVNGYMSNVRVVKGTAVYTSNFTPPTSALTAISGTSLLTCQSNRFRDASTNNFTVTPVGDTRVTDFSPFNPTYPGITYNQSDITNWSGYFQNTVSGNHLRWPFPGSPVQNAVAGTNYTIEFWVYRLPKTNTYQCMFSTENDRNNIILDASGNVYITSNGGTVMFSGFSADTYIPTYQWTHVALVCSGTTWTLYFNGTSYGTYSGASKTSYATGVAQLGARNDMDGCGYMSNFRVSTVARYSGNFTPSTSPFTNDANTAMLTLQSAAFADNSSNAQALEIRSSGGFTPTVTGNSPLNTVGYWSNYFDGTGDYLTAPYTTANFDWYTAGTDFTIEAWFFVTTLTNTSYPNGGTQAPVMCGNRDPNGGTDYWSFGPTSEGIVAFYYFSGSAQRVASTTTISAGRWNHVAMTKTSSGITLFVNGTAQTTVAISGTPQSSASFPFAIGQGGSSSYSFPGYISNLRVVRGTAIYSGNFTPPTSPLTAVTNTKLLTCQNGRFIDNSTNALTITPAGNVAAQPYNPFYTSTIASNGGSTYFDGSGDYLAVPSATNMNFGTGNWTVECWVYVSTRTTNYPLIFGNNRGSFTTDALAITASNADSSPNYIDKFVFAWGSSGFSSPSAGTSFLLVSNVTNSNNTWYHLAVVRNGTSVLMFRNGVQVANATVSSGATFNWNYNGALIGGGNWDGASGYMNGYVSNLRVTSSAVYTTAFTPPTTPLTPSGSTTLLINGMNAGIYDATNINDMETVGNAQVRYPSPFAPANYWAGAFDGSGDWLTVPNNTALQFGSGDFTVEFWANVSTSSGFRGIIGKGGAATGWAVFIDNSNYWAFSIDNLNYAGTVTPTYGAWTHVAFTRSGTTFTLYINGTSVRTHTSSSSFTQTEQLVIGAGRDLTIPYTGSISNVRLVKGAVVYTGNFTPPTEPLTAISGTSLLTCQNKTFIDNSTNAFTITAVGNATAGAIGPFTATGGTSVYFDGTGDYLHFPYPVEFFTPTSWTIEGWVYINSLASAVGIFGYSDLLITRITSTAIRIEYRNNPSSPVWMINESSYTFSTGTWYHIAFVLNNGSFRTYVNGTAVGSASTGVGAGAKGGTGPQKLIIGATDQFSFDSVDTFLNGYMDDVRITTGVARYTTNFTPPTQAFPTY